MPSSKMASGMSNVKCLAFPIFSNNKNLLKDKSCHVIEPYDDGELISIFAPFSTMNFMYPSFVPE